MLKIKNLYFNFPNSNFSLKIESLSIEPGEILALIGSNGAGKTTLLNIIALLEKPKFGNIEIFGQDSLNNKDIVSLRRQMSFVFSQVYLLNETVYDNILLPLKLRGICNKKRVDEMLEFFGISNLKNENANTISQGQKHRVVLARAFVNKPKLILLDEPFLSLDESYKENIIKSLRTIIKSNNSSAIFVTQNKTEVAALSDSIAVMKDGRIVANDNL